MKTNRIILAAVLGLASLGTWAQDTETEYTFNPHWEFQFGAGVQYTLGETCFGDLLSPNIQLGAGYWFNPYLGARLTLNGWQSRAAIDSKKIDEEWKWKYIAPQVDATANLTNLLFSYNPTRKIDWTLFGGLGANIAFGNDQASEAMDRLVTSGAYSRMTAAHKEQNMKNVWDGTKTLLVVRFGTGVDYRINDKFSVGIEAQANTLSDDYNSKDAHNSDWYFNALASVKFRLGKTYSSQEVPTRAALVATAAAATAAAEAAAAEAAAAKKNIVEKPVEVIKTVIAPLRRDIFFTIGSDNIRQSEQLKVSDIVEYLKTYPESKVSITGYADKQTGSELFNKKISEKRVNSIVKEIKNAGIDESRIITDFKGSTEQPFGEEKFESNRVAICIAQ